MIHMEKIDYDTVLRPLVGIKAVFRFLCIDETGRMGLCEARGKISRGPVYYTIPWNGDEMSLVPGLRGDLEVKNKKYSLSEMTKH
jgi:hypothetical protein